MVQKGIWLIKLPCCQKGSPHGRIILAKRQLDHSYTFWTMAFYTTGVRPDFFETDVIYLIATVNISFRNAFRELCTTLLRLWGKFRLDKHSCFNKQIRVLIQKICHPIVSNNTRRVISAVQKWGKFFNFEKKMCGDQHTYRVQCKKMLHTWHILALWQYGLWSFQVGGTKLERFLPKNQHTQRKLLNFENWVNVEVSKIGHHFWK